jgi:hypothetical protein
MYPMVYFREYTHHLVIAEIGDKDTVSLLLVRYNNGLLYGAVPRFSLFDIDSLYRRALILSFL